ncbi:cytotoxic necrotizing factor Rho-activating domain-containing protein [Pseudoxanthomonas sp. UTMC 1351]|uniref:cytotoxic necrotizing factor Rho-activating domain-containing protein n=1 Tax=Pseudoxanthomonas sp. UTMC 1351 TaxID=2695853 RepID=UPI0034CD793D
MITYLGKERGRMGSAAESITAFDYNQAAAPRFAIRAAYAYALLTRENGVAKIKVLSENVNINPRNSRIIVLASAQKRLL